MNVVWIRRGTKGLACVLPVLLLGAATLGGSGPVSSRDLERGRELYERHCSVCHGVQGRGDGDAAYLLHPAPRNIASGRFRLVSTTNGVPTQGDLIATIRRGMPGSAMPPWEWLSEEDLWSLALYVRHLAVEGQVADLLEWAQEEEEELPDAEAREIAVERMTPGPVIEVGPAAPSDPVTLHEGRRLYLKSCAACHGENGTGDAPVNLSGELRNEDGTPNTARDFTIGILKGGATHADLVRRIVGGLPGSPMPASSFENAGDAAVLATYVRSLIKPGAEERVLQRRRTVAVTRVPGPTPTAPDDPAWAQAGGEWVALMPLWWRDERVEGVVVRAVHDGSTIAFRLSWRDASENADLLGPRSFSDAAAIEISVERDPPLFNCLHQKCPFFAACAYQRSRRQMTTADVLIANHALVFSDLALREAGVQYLPSYDVLILDEAHEVEDGAAEHFGARVSAFGINRQLSRFMPKKRGSGLFGRAEVRGELYDALSETRDAVRELFTEVDRWREQTGEKRLRQAMEFPNPLHTPLSMLVADLRDRRDDIEDFELAMEWKARTDRLDESLSAVELIHATIDPDLVYWTEGSGVLDRSVLRAAPIDIAARLKRLLFREVRAVVMTSATLTVQNRFDHFHRRLGLENRPSCNSAARLISRNSASSCSTRRCRIRGLPAYEASVNAALRGLVLESEGGAFLLFTSHRALTNAHRALHAEFTAQGLLVLRQGGAMRTRDILDAFRTRRDCVLFATDTFWQGIDVRGENLRLVAVTRLPFAVPDHPLQQARVERIEEEGGDAFRELSLPQAILKLRQGFGRLIRSSEDTGRVAILDPRIVTKRYGRQFLDSLPSCRVTRREVPPAS